MIYDRAIAVAPERFKVIDLSGYTTWAIGGPSAAVTVTTPGELATTIDILRNSSIPWTVLGRGSNTLAPTEGWPGVVVFLGGKLSDFSFSGTLVHSGGGVHLPSLAGAACSMGLDGLVFAVGIPGTVGGAVFMNAGAYGSSVSMLIKKVKVLHRDGTIEYLTAGDCEFGYRSSRFQKTGSVVLEITMELERHGGGSSVLREKARDVLRVRRRKFPLRVPNAGSVFRKPKAGIPPGKLIEDCGLKGYRIGGAAVSRRHANFIENNGEATSYDVLKLIDFVVARVEKLTGIVLEREIRQLGEICL